MSEDIRVIVCIDMDAYYAQAESRKLGLEDSVPLAVQQWHSLIAVNYAAREYGITRFIRAVEAKKLCPHLILPHVDTFKLDKSTGQILNSQIDEKFTFHDRYTEKVNLKYYRTESEKIFNIIRRFVKDIEKASIDEVFFDMTNLVQESYRKGICEGETLIGECMGESKTEEKKISDEEIFEKQDDDPDASQIGVQKEEDLSEKYLTQDKALRIASQIVQKIRAQILEELKYTSSAGISYNKMLAKLASGMKKPYGQTTILKSRIPDCLRNVQIKKIRGFGRKVSHKFSELNINTVGEILDMSLGQINLIFESSEDAQYIYDRVRGHDEEEIKTFVGENGKSRSISSQKMFPGTFASQKMDDIYTHLTLIANDLYLRLMESFEETKLLPKTLSLSYYDNKAKMARIKQIEISLNIFPEVKIESILHEKSVTLIKSVQDVLLPCTSLGITVKNFVPKQQQKENTLDKYLKNFSLIKKPEPSFNISNLCSECGKSFQNEGEHKDYHLALELDRDLNPNKRKYKFKSLSETERDTKQLEPVKKLCIKK